MKIQNVNSVSFGYKAYTAKGNEYNKTYSNTKFMSIIGGVSAVSIWALPKLFTKVGKGSAYELVNYFLPKKVLALQAGISLACAVGLGMLLDCFSNTKKAQEADFNNKSK